MTSSTHAYPIDPATLLQALIRFDTTNPPGNEALACDWLAAILDAEGVRRDLRNEFVKSLGYEGLSWIYEHRP